MRTELTELAGSKPHVVAGHSRQKLLSVQPREAGEKAVDACACASLTRVIASACCTVSGWNLAPRVRAAANAP